jgi:hypothetical protein
MVKVLKPPDVIWCSGGFGNVSANKTNDEFFI